MAAMCSVAVTVGLSHVLEEMMQLFNSKGPGIPDQVVMDRGPADGQTLAFSVAEVVWLCVSGQDCPE